MKIMRIYFVFITSAALYGCARSNCPNPSSSPSEVALYYSASEGVDTKSIVISSVSEYQKGETSVIDAQRVDDYAKSLRQPLLDKKYYEVCMRPKGGGLGGEVCYFLEKETKKKLFIYRGV
jgi:hypothetical protein